MSLSKRLQERPALHRHTQAEQPNLRVPVIEATRVCGADPGSPGFASVSQAAAIPPMSAAVAASEATVRTELHALHSTR